MDKRKVWGIGLHRTATTSLHEALCALGYRSVHYPRYLWIAKRYEAASDLPIPAHYRELARAYPDSRFVLTVRDKEAWIRSVLRHRQRFPRGAGPFTAGPVRRSLRALFGGVDDDREMLSRGWDAHVAGVHAWFRDEPERLLVLDICAGEGWEKLCPFLGLSAPDRPFPSTNPGAARDYRVARA
jgi:hypothetical protein